MTPSLESLLTVRSGPLAVEAQSFAADHYSPELLAHVQRTYLFGALVAHEAGVHFEPEIAYLAALLHDLGLVEQFRDAERRFEVAGADAARAWASGRGLPVGDAERVWDAVALHSSLGIAEAKSPEAAVVHWGAGADVFGAGHELLPRDALRAVLDLHPRSGFEANFRETIGQAISTCPGAYAFTWLADTARDRYGIPLPTSEQAFSATPFPPADR